MRKTLLTLLLALAAILLAAPAAQADDYENIDYMAIGDSITVGIGTSGPSMAYPEQAHVRSIGVGWSGWSDSLGPKSFREAILPQLEALPHQPETLIFHYGVNDLIQSVPYDVLITRVKAERRELRHLGYRVVLGTIIPSPADSCWSYCKSANGMTVQQNRLAFNDWVRSQPTYIDYAAALSCGRYQCPGLTDFDDAHVNDAGAHRMAVTLRRWIRADRRAS